MARRRNRSARGGAVHGPPTLAQHDAAVAAAAAAGAAAASNGPRRGRRLGMGRNRRAARSARRSQTRVLGGAASSTALTVYDAAPAAVAFAGDRPNKGPPSYSTKGGVLTVVHCEFVTAVGPTTNGYPTLGVIANGSTCGVATQITPTNPVLFPWASAMAPLFEQWRVNYFETIYVPAASAARDGTVIQFMDPDAADVTTLIESDFMNSAMATEGALWQAKSCKYIPRDNTVLAQWRFCQPTGSATGAVNDARFNSIGTVLLAAFGATSSTRCGTWFTRYSVSFRTPQASQVSMAGLRSARINSTGVTGQTNLLQYGTGAQFTSAASAPVASASGKTLTFFTPGQYLIHNDITGTGLITGTSVNTCGGSGQSVCKGPPVYGGADLVADASGTVAIQEDFVTIASAGDTWVSDFHLLATTITNVITRILPYVYGNA